MSADLDERLRRICSALIWNAKATGLVTVWVRNLAHTFRWTTEIEAADTGPDGIRFNPDFATKLNDSELAFILLHEICHVAFDSSTDYDVVGIARGSKRQHLLNACQDAVINKALVDDAVVSKGPPAGAVMFELFDTLARELNVPPYAGSRTDSVGLYEWVLKVLPPQDTQGQPNQGQGQPQGQPQPNQGQGKPSQGQSRPGQSQGAARQRLQSLLNKPQPAAGCGPTQRSKGINPETIELMRHTLREAGQGSALAWALAPRQGRVSWRDVLKLAMTQAATDASARTTPTYSRAGRRLGAFPGIVLAGRAGAEPKLALCVDTSGSMGSEAIEAIMGECLKLQKEFPGGRVFLAAHTDRLTWAGWLKAGGDRESLIEATKRTGGTDCAEAWQAIAKAGRFDALVHFTDGFIRWPDTVPVRPERLTLALLGEHASDPHAYKGPAGAKRLGVTQVTS